MPIWLREFTFKKILKHYESKNEDNGKSWLEGDIRKEAMKKSPLPKKPTSQNNNP